MTSPKGEKVPLRISFDKLLGKTEANKVFINIT